MKQNHQKRSHGKAAANRRKNNVRRSQKTGKHAHGTWRPYAHRRAHTMDTPPAHTAEELLYGTFGATAHGYGFFCPDEKEPTADPFHQAPVDQTTTSKELQDYFVPANATMGAMDGDRVTAILRKDRYPGKHMGDYIALICSIQTRATQTLVGTLQIQPTKSQRCMQRFVIPDDPKINNIVVLSKNEKNNANAGDKVKVQITAYPSAKDRFYRGTLAETYGPASSRAANEAAILDEYHVRTAFSPAQIQEAQIRAAAEIKTDGRKDLRNTLIFTIDGADAKDLDDAVSISVLPNGFLLGVHIADVSTYVTQGCETDREAFLRGTSIYFGDHVIPMLPQSLSNGACSLNAEKDRYALSAFIRLDADGNILDCSLEESVIRSAVRGVYTEVNDVLENAEASPYYKKYAVLFPDCLPQMLRLYKILLKKSEQRGALTLDTEEPLIVFDAQGEVADIHLRHRGTAERMIEQFMLCANEAVATKLHDLGIPCVYRVHDTPPSDKLQTLLLFAHQLHLPTKGITPEHVSPKAMQELLQCANEQEVGACVSHVMLRTLAKANYSAKQSPHFGLAIDCYCHFTSPIRRYPDLVTHRIIKAVLHHDTKALQMLASYASKAATQSSECEINAQRIEWEMNALYQVLYLQHHIGECFEGIITGVASFGFFVDFYNGCEGLVSAHSLPGIAQFDETQLCLQCGKQRFIPGNRVHVRLQHADVVTRKVDLSLIDPDVAEISPMS